METVEKIGVNVSSKKFPSLLNDAIEEDQNGFSQSVHLNV
jgi:hypothetical protein